MQHPTGNEQHATALQLPRPITDLKAGASARNQMHLGVPMAVKMSHGHRLLKKSVLQKRLVRALSDPYFQFVNHQSISQSDMIPWNLSAISIAKNHHL